MTNSSTFTFLTTFGIALSLGLLAATACGGSASGTEPAGNSGASGSGSGGSSGGSGTAGSGGSGTGGACEAGSSVQGGGTDMCPQLAWKCVNQSVGNPPVTLAGAECSTGHTGGCCSYSDKCLTNTDGSANAKSAVEVAIEPCQAGCITNPSAQACLDCINSSLMSAGKPKLSNSCGTCWTSLLSCSFMNCLTPCLAGAATPGCRQCVFTNCMVGVGKFNECSGTLSNGGL